jgi:hypothetical protein
MVLICTCMAKWQGPFNRYLNLILWAAVSFETVAHLIFESLYCELGAGFFATKWLSISNHGLLRLRPIQGW